MKISIKCVRAAAQTTIYGGGALEAEKHLRAFVKVPKEKERIVRLPASSGFTRWKISTPTGRKANSGMLRDGALDKAGWDIWHHLIHTPGTMFYYLGNEVKEVMKPCPPGCEHHDRGMPTCYNLKRYAFLTGYDARSDQEEAEVQALSTYFKEMNEDPGWPIAERKVF